MEHFHYINETLRNRYFDLTILEVTERDLNVFPDPLLTNILTTFHVVLDLLRSFMINKELKVFWE